MKSKYKPYPSYKDSGVKWMGEVPKEWISIKLKQVLIHKTKTTNHGLDCGSISFGTVVYKDNEKIPEETRASYQEVLAGEFLINPLNLNFDLKSLRTALSTLNVVVSTGYIVLQSKSNIEKHYLRWLLYQFDVAHMKTLGAGVRQTVNYTDIGNEYFFMPPLQEQKAIATYLDRATQKIDTLIAKQEQLIALLKEKRQALISHAVTKGLNPDAKMKESGVAWLGEIPEGWTATPLRYIGQLQNGISKGGSYFGTGFPFVNYGDIYNNAVLPLEVKGLAMSSKEDQQVYSVKKGDVFFTRTSETIDDIGMASTCIETIREAIFSGFTIRFRQIRQVLNEHFSKYYFRTGHAQAFFEEQLNLVTRASLGQDILKQLPVLLPPIEEQKAIATYLDQKTQKIDTLISKATKAITLLKEKRTALISAVVTGKVDVRGEVV